MGELRNCPDCKRLFSTNGSNMLCADCLGREKNDYVKVREYIFDHPGVNVRATAKGTGISESIILRLIREGRFELK